jgi:hypothetical protein
MLRLACLLLFLSSASAVFAASADVTAAVPTAAGTAAACEAKPAQTAADATAESSASDAPAQRIEAASPRPGANSGSRVRPASTRWHRLLPGMFR